MSAHNALIRLTPKPPSTAHAFDLENGTVLELKTGSIHHPSLHLSVCARASVSIRKNLPHQCEMSDMKI